MKATFTKLFAVAIVCLLSISLVDAQPLLPVKIRVNTPDVIDFRIDGIRAQFGGDIVGELSGEVVKALDGITEPTDNDLWSETGWYCCEAVANPEEVDGRIAIISRGACEFGLKTLNAEEAGATAAIIANRAPIGLTVGTHESGLIWMAPGTLGDSTSIPSIFISHEDRNTLEAIMESNGGIADITIEANWMYDAAAANQYSTPLPQVSTIDTMQLVIVNRDTVPLLDFSFTATVTDPSGGTAESTVVIDTIPAQVTDGSAGSETSILFPIAYTPTEAGEYTVTYTAESPAGDHPLDEETYDLTFEVNDNNIFKHSAGPPNTFDGITIRNESYQDINVVFNFNVGALFYTGESADPTSVVGITWSLFNPEELAPGLLFAITMYDADPDGDGDLDNDADGSITNLDVFTELVGIGTYELTGDESSRGLITVEFDEAVELGANKTYLVMISHDGLQFDNFNCPSFTSAGDPSVLNYGSVYEIGIPDNAGYEFEVDGFEYWNDDTPGLPHAGRQPFIRLNLDNFLTNLEEVGVLDASKIALQPNPASEYTNLVFDLDEVAEDVQIRILNLDGKLVQTQSLSGIQQQTIPVNVENLPAGTYFVTVVTPEGYRAKKLTVLD